MVAPTAQPFATAAARSRSAVLIASPRIRSCEASSSPTRTLPSMMAVTAGTAPAPSTAASVRVSAASFAGDGSPRFEKMVLSSATTGWPEATASATAALKMVFVMGFPFSWRATRLWGEACQHTGGDRMAVHKSSLDIVAIHHPSDEPCRECVPRSCCVAHLG